MAYSCVKVLFEIGHEASIRTKRTPEGFTHDWEVFVRGVDNSDIFHFVEKVVFHLHETFPKPKRVVKEPPYSVKESGYAGFVLPIDIYFKNCDEPKKVRFNYDLHLQNTGAPISKVMREQYVFLNPAEDLRRRLIKGGGVGVLGSESGFHLASSEKLPPPSSDEAPGHKHSVQGLVGKPKLSGNDSSKKHKVKEGKNDETRVSNSFQDLFGPPIKTAKVSPDPKKTSSSSSHSSPKVSPASKSTKSSGDKSSADKPEKSSKSGKHGSQREGKESAERSSSSSSGSKEEKKEKDKNRDKDKNKDKVPKRPSTPVKPASTPPKRPSTPPKRPPSPPKRPPSPKLLAPPPPPSKLSTSPKHLSSSKPNKEESKKSSSEDNKSKNESKSGESNKSEKKKKDKKNRDEKPKKDKHKDHEKSSEKVVKNEKSKESKDKDLTKKLEKEAIKEPEKSREKEKDKSKHNDGDKEKQRHKHKKKDKSNKDKDRDKERDKEKSSKKSSEGKTVDVRDKEKNGLANELSRGSADASDISAPHKKQAASSPSPSPVRPASSPMKPSPTPEKCISSVPVKEKIKRLPLSDDSSDSHSSVMSDEEVESPINRIKSVKTESGLVPVDSKPCVLPVTEPPRPNSRNELLKPKSENSNQERNSLNKSSSKQKEKSSKKNKEREAGSGDGEKPEKDSKKNKRKRSNRILEDVDNSRNNGETPLKIPKLEVESDDLPMDTEPLEEKAAVEELEIKEESEPEEPPPPTTSHLTEEYVSQLRELQHKIMTLEDNAELQRVVQVIAETGQYEITKKTFDFDLCALDRSTVQRLQEFFAPS